MALEWLVVLIIAALIVVPSVVYWRGFQTGFRAGYHAAAGGRPPERQKT